MQNDSENSIALATSQEEIAKRLEALNRWQDEQKRLLEERQNNQRLILGMEQRNMYQLLGLIHKEVESAESSILEESDVEDDQAGAGAGASIQMPRHTEYQEEEGGGDSQPTAKPKRPFLRRGEGLQQRFKINPDQLRLENLPRYKFANAHPQFRPHAQKKGILKTRKETKKVAPALVPAPSQPPELDFNEQRFQKLLISSKTACNSTPDLKSSYASSSTTTSLSPKVRFAEQRSRDHAADDEQSSEASALTGVCWAKVLNAQAIKPVPLIQRRTAQIRLEDDSNVSIFELLEQKAQEGNFDMNSSCIRTFMARKEQRRQTADDTDQIVVTQQVRQMHLQPEVAQITEIDDDDEEDEAEEDQTSDLTMTPIQLGKNQVRVRFSDSNDTHDTTLGDGSNVQLFEQFKSALFQALEQKKKSASPTKSANEPPEPLTKELQEKANLVRSRLEELETEIATFKKQNMELLRLKQKHELEKAKCAQDHLEAMDRVHDEKIQAEIYLHDERMKIEEERRKFDQQMRLQKSNASSKEKKEIAALRQEVESLQLQLKQKEQTHVSAQARLRAQLRACEKEQRLYRDEIELLGKENKRLEQELIKVSRENNSKMLQEINRNIARLAPKVLLPTDTAQPIDENGRRTKSLDGPAKQRESMSRRQSSGSVPPTRGQSSGYGQPPRSRGTAKKKPEEVLDESYPSSSSASEAEDETPAVAAAASSTVEPAAAPSDFKREIVNADGSKDIWYPNGNLKKISADAMTVRMLYFNKDIKESDIREGTIKYYYAESNTWHTTYLDGLEILEFPNGQTEHRHKNGTIEIRFPNNTIKLVDPSDEEVQEEWRYADGTRLVQLRNGDKILNLPNGQKEIHTKLNKRREYPDGTVKLVYPDGSQETRYSNGRVRLKDKDGKLIMDTDYAKY